MAAGQPYKGKQFRLKIDGTSIYHATDCSFTTSRTMESVASKDTNGEESSPGNYTWGVSTNHLVADKPSGSTTQIGLKEVLDKYQAGTLVEVEFSTYIDGDVIISGEGYIETCSLSAPTNGVMTGDFSIKGNGDFTTSLFEAP